MAATRTEAVIFDWGGTLTRWHDVDFHAESVALAHAVRRTPTPDDDHHAWAERLHRAGESVWGRSRDRLFDDVWGAHNAGLRAIHVPLSTIPATQVGHTEGEPDATISSLAEVPAVVRALDKL